MPNNTTNTSSNITEKRGNIITITITPTCYLDTVLDTMHKGLTDKPWIEDNLRILPPEPMAQANSLHIFFSH